MIISIDLCLSKLLWRPFASYSNFWIMHNTNLVYMERLNWTLSFVCFYAILCSFVIHSKAWQIYMVLATFLNVLRATQFPSLNLSFILIWWPCPATAAFFYLFFMKILLVLVMKGRMKVRHKKKKYRLIISYFNKQLRLFPLQFYNSKRKDSNPKKDTSFFKFKSSFTVIIY